MEWNGPFLNQGLKIADFWTHYRGGVGLPLEIKISPSGQKLAPKNENGPKSGNFWPGRNQFWEKKLAVPCWLSNREKLYFRRGVRKCECDKYHITLMWQMSHVMKMKIWRNVNGEIFRQSQDQSQSRKFEADCQTENSVRQTEGKDSSDRQLVSLSSNEWHHLNLELGLRQTESLRNCQTVRRERSDSFKFPSLRQTGRESSSFNLCQEGLLGASWVRQMSDSWSRRSFKKNCQTDRVVIKWQGVYQESETETQQETVRTGSLLCQVWGWLSVLTDFWRREERDKETDRKSDSGWRGRKRS